MATSFTRLIFCMGFGAMVGIGTAHAEGDVLPDSLAQQLSTLIQGSVGGEINPGIYQLAYGNPEYADEIACIAVQFFGNPAAIEGNILSGLDDPDQKQAVATAVSACSEREVAGGYGEAVESFNQGLSGGGLNTLSSTQDSVSPVAP